MRIRFARMCVLLHAGAGKNILEFDGGLVSSRGQDFRIWARVSLVRASAKTPDKIEELERKCRTYDFWGIATLFRPFPKLGMTQSPVYLTLAIRDARRVRWSARPRECGVVLIDRHNLSEHRLWIIGVALATSAAAAWFLVEGLRAPTWPGGSSVPGLAFGAAGGLIILFEMMLWWRKNVRGLPAGSVKNWMRAHIWLGLLCLPLLVLHSGFSLGGWLSTILMFLLIAVVGSGIWGLAVQQILPTRMLEEMAAENLRSEANHIVSSLVIEAERLVSATFRSAGGKPSQSISESGMGTGATTTKAEVTVLHEFAGEVLLPYLRGGAASDSPLRLSRRAEMIFANLKDRLEPGMHETADQLNALCEQRRQLDLRLRLHFWLHNWLCLHTPLSVALVVLMFIHVWVALQWW